MNADKGLLELRFNPQPLQVRVKDEALEKLKSQLTQTDHLRLADAMV